MKFGGSTLASDKGIEAAYKIVEDHVKRGDRVAVVVSAVGDTTDKLIEACSRAAKGETGFIEAFIDELKVAHQRLYDKLLEDEFKREAEKIVSSLLEELKGILIGVSRIAEATPKVKDYILSFGERLSAPIFWAGLRSRGISSEWFTGKDAGIVTDSNFGNARPLVELTLHQVKNRIGKLYDEGCVPTITGFIAADQHGRITTMGRGGSDLTATLIGAALDVDEVWLWTDVNGIMTADPKIEPEAKTIRQLSYQEALEMAFFGAKGIHPRAIEAAMEKNIPIRIKNTFDPEGPSTLITSEVEVKPGFVAKAVSLIPKVAIVTVGGAGMIDAPEVAAKVLQTLAEKKVSILMISQGSSEANISFAVPREGIEELTSMLELNLLGRKFIREITVEEDACIVALVGAGMKGTPGVAARVFSAIAKEGINIRMIAQGSSELNISFVVKETDGFNAVRALHREFRLGEIS